MTHDSSFLAGHRPGHDLQHLHASLLVDGERPRVQGDPGEPSAHLGSRGPPLHQHSRVHVGVPVRGGGAQFPADRPGGESSPDVS